MPIRQKTLYQMAYFSLSNIMGRKKLMWTWQVHGRWVTGNWAEQTLRPVFNFVNGYSPSFVALIILS